MRRVPVLSSVVVVVLGFMMLARTGPSAVQGATQPADGQGFVGSWRVAVTPPQGTPFVTLSTFGADGTVLTSTLPAQQPPPGAPSGTVFFSTAHGAWEATGADTAIATFVHLRASADGQPVGTVTIRLSITLGADADTFGGEYAATLADAAGNVPATPAGTVEATRIVAESPGTPTVGTPTG